ncbi:MAG TPA: hypothetical protein VEM77_05400 [Thermoplasmata archaeon]|nr:hypothetical protein [Thermoplasmata archaeon]
MVAIENVFLAAVSVFALALTVISVLAFRRSRDAHLVFLAAAFGVFFVKGLVLTIALFVQPLSLGQFFLLSGALDLVILGLFYGFTLRR